MVTQAPPSHHPFKPTSSGLFSPTSLPIVTSIRVKRNFQAKGKIYLFCSCEKPYFQTLSEVSVAEAERREKHTHMQNPSCWFEHHLWNKLWCTRCPLKEKRESNYHPTCRDTPLRQASSSLLWLYYISSPKWLCLVSEVPHPELLCFLFLSLLSVFWPALFLTSLRRSES